MNDRYEIDGIIYFKSPFEVDYLDWLAKHLDCDSVIEKETSYSDVVHVICYARTSDYNKNLRAVKNMKYPDDKILQGLSSEEVNCID